VRDLISGTTILASVATNGGPADGICSEPAISGNGRFVAFTSGADNLVPGDTNRTSDIFVRDLQAGTTTLVSTNATGSGPGNNLSESPAINGDGRFVLFRSRASNLVTGQSFTAGTENLFIRDMQASTTYALTLSGLSSASMTPDGTLVAYADNSAASAGKFYIWDTQAGMRIETNTLPAVLSSLPMSLAPNGTKGACLAGTSGIYVVDRVARTNGLIATGYPIGSRVGLRFSADARFLTYAAAPSAAGTNQVYLYDFATKSNLLVSARFGTATGGNAASDWPEISADGRFIAYRSFATNLLAVRTSNTVPSLFLYDLLAGSSTLLSASSLTGGPSDNRSLSPVLSADGQTLLFQSWASDLVPGDFNHWDDIFAQAFFYAAISPGDTPGSGLKVTWPAQPGETYEVQFKNHLEDLVWQPVKGSILVNGSQASLVDVTPPAGTRFYRVVVH
jgi:Tol biopolymer transport system component